MPRLLEVFAVLALTAAAGGAYAAQPLPPLVELVLEQEADGQPGKATGLFIHYGQVEAKEPVELAMVSNKLPDLFVQAMQNELPLEVTVDRVTNDVTGRHRMVLHFVTEKDEPVDLRVRYRIADIARWRRVVIVPLDQDRIVEDISITNSTILPWGAQGEPFRIVLTNRAATAGAPVEPIWHGKTDPIPAGAKRRLIVPTLVSLDADTLWVDLSDLQSGGLKRYIRFTNAGRRFPAATAAMVVGLPSRLPSTLPATIDIPLLAVGPMVDESCPCDTKCGNAEHITTIQLGNANETAVAASLLNTPGEAHRDFLPIEYDTVNKKILLVKAKRFQLCLTNRDDSPRKFMPFVNDSSAHALASQVNLCPGLTTLTAWKAKCETEAIDVGSTSPELETVKAWVEALEHFKDPEAVARLEVLLRQSKVYLATVCNGTRTSAEYVAELLEAVTGLLHELESQAAAVEQHDRAQHELERLVSIERRYLAMESPEAFYYEIVALRDQIEKQRENVRQLKLDLDLIDIASMHRKRGK